MVDVVVVTTSVGVVTTLVVVGGGRVVVGGNSVPVGGRGSLAQPARTRAPANRAARNRFTALPPFAFTLVPEEKADNYN